MDIETGTPLRGPRSDDRLTLDGRSLTARALMDFAFRRRRLQPEIPADVSARIERAHSALQQLMERKTPIYGVTTGFGDSGNRTISAHQSEQLQRNLVSYLLCGSGPLLSPEVSRAILTVRLNSMAKGHSGVSIALIDRMKLHLERDWLPVIPREGSLGASGDLIPLAYLAQNIQGKGKVFVEGDLRDMSEVLRNSGLAPYELKAKEGLALVNGTSAMAGMFAVNLNHAKFLTDWVALNTSWLCLALQGRTEAFGQLVNEASKNSSGQAEMARKIRVALEEENYRSKPLGQIRVEESRTEEWVQDRYSLRCVPQIGGPILETMALLERWLTDEINGASDNPLIGEDGSLANGGNFYGGYMSHGMDYLKISLAHLADLVDRQTAYVIDDKSNRGLPANLANWPGLPEDERHLHHGLKGLHQSVGAITSEIMARATPGGIFSRSSESHNQDKVSLGLSAASQAADMIEQMFTILTLQSVVLAQALDLRGVRLKGVRALTVYDLIRRSIPFVSADRPLGEALQNLKLEFLNLSRSRGAL